MIYNLSNRIKLICGTVIVTLAMTTFVFYLAGSFDKWLDKGLSSNPSIQTSGKAESSHLMKHKKIEPEYIIVDTDEKNNIEVYKQTSPGVVNIIIFNQVMRFNPDFFMSPSYKKRGSGSGSVIDKQGHILTNYHVIKNADQLVVTVNNKQFQAELITGIDPENDLAVIKINAPSNLLHPISISESPNLVVGQKVLAIGNPFGLDKTLTTGIISSLGRTIPIPSGMIENIIQTDAAINPGNSGGPLLNNQGELIGVNTLIKTPNGGSVGIGFAIPSTTVKPVIKDLIEYGEVKRPKMGVTGYPLSQIPGLNTHLKLPIDEGFIVNRVVKGLSADLAGINGFKSLINNRYYERIPIGGDIIINIDHRVIRNRNDISLALRSKRHGQIVPVTIFRNKNKLNWVKKTLNIKLVVPN